MGAANRAASNAQPESESLAYARISPFLKWAGGKRLLLDYLLPHFQLVPRGRCYFEPFLGGGAAYFALLPERAVLSDVNPDLIQAYVGVRDDPEGVIGHLRAYERTREAYYRVRAQQPEGGAERAARFIYLNKLCFNGLYRVNARGMFNVPFGRHGDNQVLCDEMQIRTASEALQGVRLVCSDFECVVAAAQDGDLVYFDPPYTTAHSSNGFVEYNAKVFSWEDQLRLARCAHALVSTGVNVVVSNADHASIRCLYEDQPGFETRAIGRWSTIAASAGSRRRTTEILILGSQHRD